MDFKRRTEEELRFFEEFLIDLFQNEVDSTAMDIDPNETNSPQV